MRVPRFIRIDYVLSATGLNSQAAMRAVTPLALILSFLLGACAPVDIDRDRLPLGTKGKARFDHYLSLEFEKAFAINPARGRWYFSWGYSSQYGANERALAGCEKSYGPPCELLTEGHTIVGKHLLRPKHILEGPPKKVPPKRVSLEEAKRITATIEGPSFIAPPRTVNDLLAELDALSASNNKLLAGFRASADAPAPDTNDNNELARHFAIRADAARMLGRYSQALEDAQKAIHLATNNKTKRSALSSLSHAQEEMGNYRKAVEIYTKKAALGSRTSHVIVDYSVLAKFLALNGDFHGADEALERAKSRVPEMSNWTRGRHWIPFIESLLDMAVGEASLLQGAYLKAETTLRLSVRRMDEDIASGGHNDEKSNVGKTLQQIRYGTRTHNSRNLSLAVMRQGRLVEAEAIARETVLMQARVYGRYSGQTLEGLRALSQIVTEQGRFDDAEKLVRASLDIFERIGVKKDSLTLGISRRTLADTYVGQGRWRKAQEVYEALAQDLAERPEGLARILDANLSWAIPLIRLNRASEAAGRLEESYVRFIQRVGRNHYDAAEAQGMLASALSATGNKSRSLKAFSEALPILLSRENLSQSEGTTNSGRQTRLRFILDSYIDLLIDTAASGGKLPNGTNAIDEAFRVANAARGGKVKRALASSAARSVTGNPELADLARREQDALQKIGALNGVLRNAGRDIKVTEALRTRIRELKVARAALMKEIIRRFPNYADLIDPSPATIREARKALRAGEAVITTYSTGERTYVWAIPKRGEVAFAAVEIGHAELSDKVTVLRGALEPNARTLGDIPEFDLATAHELYSRLLAPVELGWKEAKSLLVVAHGALGYLPLSLLPTAPAALPPQRKPLFARYRDIPWLARTHAVTMLPSVASLKALRNLAPGDGKRSAFAGFGDPWFSKAQAAEATRSKKREVAALTATGLVKTRGLPVRLRAVPKTQQMDSADLAILPRLPDTADEVKSIALAMNADPTKSVFVGKDASEGRVKSMDLSGVRVLVFATHGLVPGDLNGLTQPALALSSPKVTGGKDDGLLTMGEILGLKLNADWVVLSACNTGSGEGAGAEAVSGLGRAFFYAGTRALLVSNWPVHSAATTALITDMFRRQAEDPTLGRSEASRRAMLSLIDGDGYVDDKGRTVFSYAHPIFWAPFTVVGDGGGGRPGT